MWEVLERYVYYLDRPAVSDGCQETQMTKGEEGGSDRGED